MTGNLPFMLTRQRGFTLLELMVVMVIIALLLSLAAPRYFRHLDRAKEVALKQTLFIMRDALDKYQGDTGRLPTSLDELVSARYLRQRPLDPITERSDTWQVVRPSGSEGVFDVRSGAPGQALDGSRYADW